MVSCLSLGTDYLRAGQRVGHSQWSSQPDFTIWIALHACPLSQCVGRGQEFFANGCWWFAQAHDCVSAHGLPAFANGFPLRQSGLPIATRIEDCPAEPKSQKFAAPALPRPLVSSACGSGSSRHCCLAIEDSIANSTDFVVFQASIYS